MGTLFNLKREIGERQQLLLGKDTDPVSIKGSLRLQEGWIVEEHSRWPVGYGSIIQHDLRVGRLGQVKLLFGQLGCILRQRIELE